MTYRRLFISLCLAGLFLLAGAWWSSLHHWFRARASLPGGSFVKSDVVLGTLHLNMGQEDGAPRPGFHADAAPIGKNSYPDYGAPFGDLDWGRVLMDGEPSTGSYSIGSYYIYYSQTPLWLIYLTFVAIAYLALRRPMRKQRLLEEQGASPSNSLPGE